MKQGIHREAPDEKINKYFIGLLLFGVVIAIFALLFSGSAIIKWYHVLSDKALVRRWVAGFGPAAPVVFVMLQVAQVVIAPVPGEISGFVGGYLFGVWGGFFLSTLGLTLGSVINFGAGRLLGEKWVRRMLGRQFVDKMDRFTRRQGALLVFLFFLFPGFPKDYLCLALGITSMPFWVFFVIVFVGRMPGTLMLSLQGGLLFEDRWVELMIVGAASLVLFLAATLLRQKIYAWIESFNGGKN